MKRFNLLLALLFTLLTIGLSAQGGSLDPTFGTNGLVITSFKGHLYTAALQADGKIVVAGTSEDKKFALARFNPNGTLDNTFGSSGIVTTRIGSYDDRIYSIALRSDGKIIAAGYSQNPRFVRDFTIARYDSAGALDTSFGNSGLVITDFGLGFGDYVARSVVIQPDGKIVAAGNVYHELRGQFLLARFNEDGSLDVNFGTGGKLVNNFSPSIDVAESVLLQPNGKIIVGGSSELKFDRNANFALARYNPNGTLDNSFGFNGLVTTDFIDSVGSASFTDVNSSRADIASSFAIQPNGKIIAVGTSFIRLGWDPVGLSWTQVEWDFELARYNTDGSLDDSFGTDGKLITPCGSGSGWAWDGVLQADGKIIMAGMIDNGENWDFVIFRYNPNGSLDDSFGTNGKITTDFNDSKGFIRSVIILPDGKFLVAGNIIVPGGDPGGGIDWPSGADYIFTLARYLSE